MANIAVIISSIANIANLMQIKAENSKILTFYLKSGKQIKLEHSTAKFDKQRWQSERTD